MAAFGIAASCLAVQAAPADDPLTRLLKSDTDSLCFRRDYDATHLKRHPKQATQAALFSFRRDAVRILLRQNGKEHYVVASCEFREGAGYDTSGKLMIKAFRKPSGYDCLVMVAPESAEEGGYVLFAPNDAEASSLTFYVQSPITARAAFDQRPRSFNLKLGADDREFRLKRTDNAACKGMEEGLKGP